MFHSFPFTQTECIRRSDCIVNIGLQEDNFKFASYTKMKRIIQSYVSTFSILKSNALLERWLQNIKFSEWSINVNLLLIYNTVA